MPKTITLTLTNYYITGIAHITLWGGDKGTIKMKPFYIDTIPQDLSTLPINDAGFGCESIDSAEIEIYENYEGCKKFHSSEFIDNLNNQKKGLQYE